MSIQDDISRFCGYFSKQINEVAKVESRLFRKTLYMTIIDTLSRASYRPKKLKRLGNKERFVGFIDRCSGWAEKDRVSAQLLALSFEAEGRDHSKLYCKAQEIVNSWSDGINITPDKDLLLADAESLAKCRCEKDKVEHNRYANLLYTYRNNLVHEFREPGHTIELPTDGNTPFYHSTIGKPWELVFPLGFIEKLCGGCLQRLAPLLHDENRTPYDSYDFGDRWQSR